MLFFGMLLPGAGIYRHAVLILDLAIVATYHAAATQAVVTLLQCPCKTLKAMLFLDAYHLQLPLVSCLHHFEMAVDNPIDNLPILLEPV
jgi:hypothetical protein